MPLSVTCLYECRVRPLRPHAASCALIEAALVNAGLKQEELVETLEPGRSEQSVRFYLSHAARARKMRAALIALRKAGVCFSFCRLPDDSWKTRWKRYCRPFYLTPSLRIIPAWTRKASDKGIVLDTTFAFGTGLHPTTRMMASLIEGARGELGAFLDVGTGSGILALVALACGARKVVAIDNDRVAVRTARTNFNRNGFGAVRLYALPAQRYTGKAQFDFVAANLITEDLVLIQKKLIAFLRPGGLLAVSGIYRSNYARLRRRFRDRRLRCVRVLTQKNWYAVLWRLGGAKAP